MLGLHVLLVTLRSNIIITSMSEPSAPKSASRADLRVRALTRTRCLECARRRPGPGRFLNGISHEGAYSTYYSIC